MQVNQEFTANKPLKKTPYIMKVDHALKFTGLETVIAYLYMVKFFVFVHIKKTISKWLCTCLSAINYNSKISIENG